MDDRPGALRYLDAAPDATLVLDGTAAEATVLAANGRAARLFGRDLADLAGRPFAELIPGGGAALARATGIPAGGAPPGADAPGAGPASFPGPAGDGRVEGCRADGSTFLAEVAWLTTTRPEGLRVVVSVRDGSHRRQAEDRFRGLLEAAPDAMVMVDRQGRVALVNGQAERLFGWSRDDLLGQPVEVLVPESARAGHPGQRDRYFAHPTTRPMGAGRELEALRRDGTTFPAEISLSAFPSDDGLIVLSAIRDVTARKETEREAVAARAEAERANRAKSEFLSRMSHELRTPLNAILGFAQLLEYNDPRPDQAEHIGFILHGGHHLLALIDEVLDISRIEAGRLSLELEPVPVIEIVRETIDLVAPLAGERQVLFRLDPDAPRDAVVLADRQRLKQVLLNLTSNAVKYNRSGGEVHISWSGRDGNVRVRVRDTGVGIRQEAMERLFLPFERLGDDTGVPGTGLGLALSRGLVQGMQGRIGAESTYQSGSTFWLELQAAPGGGVAVLEDDPDGGGPAVRRVLYVEDNLSNLRLVEDILRRRPDVEVVPTLQGSMALDLARRHHPDLILLDLHLPDVPGEEVLAGLQDDPATRDIPVIVVSADAMTARIDELLAAGAFGYLTKPLDVARFLELVDLALLRVPPA